MADPAPSLAELSDPVTPEAAAILDALGFPVFVVGADDAVCGVNVAAEQVVDQGAASLVGQPRARLVPPDSPGFSLIAQVRTAGSGDAGGRGNPGRARLSGVRRRGG